MIRDNIKRNETVGPNSREIDKLKKSFPQYFDKDGKFLIDRFEKMLQNEEIDIQGEGYELNFLGKSYARYLSSSETETVITPNLEHNQKEINKNSDNIYLIGDNVDAIKHLLNSYSGQIECIYIDPPYNTGNKDFVYPDNFKFDKESLSKAIGIEENEAERILGLAGQSTHSAWLTFMYPRLLLARDLLSDDGVIFISIDDNELYNLRLLCDDIFGEANFITNLIWQNKKGGGNDATHVAIEHEYVVMIAKNKELLLPLFEKYEEKYLKRYNEEDEIGRYYWDTFRRKSGKQYYPIECPDGTVLEFDENNNPISWLRSEKRFHDDLKKGEIKFEKRETGWSVMFKQRLPKGKKPRSLFKDGKILSEYGTNSDGSSSVLDLFRFNAFDNPKPVELVKYLIELILPEGEGIVLDFFSGSSTTAHAVMQLNAEEGSGNRKYILVQLPEKIDKRKTAYKKGYRTIDEIGRARIEKAAEKIKEETNADIDYGYRLYRLNEPTKQTIDKMFDFDPQQSLVLDDPTQTFAFDNTPGSKTILSTWMNMDGYGLVSKPKNITLNDYVAPYIGGTLYIIEKGLESDDVIDLIKKIETNQINISRIVVYPYSIRFHIAHELKKNLKNLRNGKKVNVIERY